MLLHRSWAVFSLMVKIWNTLIKIRKTISTPTITIAPGNQSKKNTRKERKEYIHLGNIETKDYYLYDMMLFLENAKESKKKKIIINTNNRIIIWFGNLALGSIAKGNEVSIEEISALLF
jgi:hypothetical protein